jgi:hypothetical protein
LFGKIFRLHLMENNDSIRADQIQFSGKKGD